jgi:hypothetical protein
MFMLHPSGVDKDIGKTGHYLLKTTGGKDRRPLEDNHKNDQDYK